jgi:DNA-binding IscR family transcriptional regulator
MRRLTIDYVLPLVVSLTTAPDGCLSIVLLTQSTLIASNFLKRLMDKVRSSFMGIRSSTGTGGGSIAASEGSDLCVGS